MYIVSNAIFNFEIAPQTTIIDFSAFLFNIV